MIRKKDTKELMGESLRELAHTKPINKITVREIAENCGMSSATFYNHFKDKYELIAWIYNDRMEKVLEVYAKNDLSWKKVLTELINYLNEDKPYFKNALKNTSGQNSFYYSTNQQAINLLIDLLQKRHKKALNKEVIFDIKFYVSGLSNIVANWFLNNSSFSIEVLVQYLINAIPVKLEPYLK